MKPISISKNKSMSETQQFELEVRQRNLYVYNKIRDLVEHMKMLSKEQLWMYFSDVVEKDAVSHIIHQMIKDKVLFSIKNENHEKEARTRYITDERLLNADYFKVPGTKGIENTFETMEYFKEHMQSMENHMASFWIFLDFKRMYDADYPISIASKDYPFIVMVFCVKDKQWEILRIRENEERNYLQILSTKEKYLEDKNPNYRIVIIDKESQIEQIQKYNIKHIVFYAIMDIDGNTQYIRTKKE